MKKLTPEKKAAKTAKFQATMARKRALKDAADEIPLDAIPDRAPARKGGRKKYERRTSETAFGKAAMDHVAVLTLLRLAVRLLEGKA